MESKGKKERVAKPEPPSALTCLMDDMTPEALANAIYHAPKPTGERFIVFRTSCP